MTTTDVSVECEQCARVFPDVTALADHVACVHGIEPTGP